MRVTFVLKSADRSGGVRVVSTYAEALRQRGHEVFLVSVPARMPLERRIKNLLKGKGMQRFYPRPSSPLDDLPDLTHVVLEDERPVIADDVPDADVVIATWWETAEWVDEMPLTKGEKVYLIQHDETVFPFMSDAERERVRATWAFSMTRVVVSNWIADRIRSQPRLFSDRREPAPLEVIANGVDLALFAGPPREKRGVPTLGMMYSPVAFKGCDLGLGVIERMKAQIPDLRVIAFGAHEVKPELPLPPWIEYVQDPPQAELAAVYASLDCYLFCSRLEGFGLPILEAMAARTPVAGFDTGAAAELIAGGGGELAPVEDVEALTAAAHGILTADADTWARYSTRAFATAEIHGWAGAVDAFESLLQRAAAG